MTRIIYKIIGNRAEMRSFDADSSLIADIEILPHSDGYLAIGGEVVHVSAGRATVDLSGAGIGEHTPIFYSDSVVTLEPIRRDRSSLSFPRTPESTLRAMLVRCECLEEETKRLSRLILELASRVGREIIF